MTEIDRKVGYAEVDKIRAWKRNAKGRGLRWQIQREIAAIGSRLALTSTQMQDTMSLRRGLSHKKCTELLGELERSKAMEQLLDPATGYYWQTTELGVSIYLAGKRQGIPVSVVQEAVTLQSVKQSGRLQNE